MSTSKRGFEDNLSGPGWDAGIREQTSRLGALIAATGLNYKDTPLKATGRAALVLITPAAILAFLASQVR